jgi:hypothetical protein
MGWQPFVRVRLRAAAAVALGLALAVACAHDGPDPRRPALCAPGGASQVVASGGAGVRLIVDGNARRAIAGGLVPAPGLLPLAITIENRGPTALVLRPGAFALTGQAGQHYPALLAAEVVAAVAPPPALVAAPTFMSRVGDQPVLGMRGPPPVVPVPALSRWETSFPYDTTYIKGFRGDRAGLVARIEAQLLREGPLPSGATASGLVYFSSAAARDREVALRADLVEASDGALIGQALIPMRVVR